MFQQVTVVSPDNDRGYTNLGAIFIIRGKYSLAIPVLQRAISIRPSSEAFSNLATAYFYLRQFDEAARNYAKAVELQSANYVAWGDLAETYYWAGQRTKAAEAYRRAIALGGEAAKVNSRDADLLGRLALYHAMLGEHAPAQQLIRRALAFAPSSADLRAKAAMVQLQAGHRDRALYWLEQAVSANLSPSQISNNPIFDQLSGDKRFQALLQR
jgi:serine/threonine-protein kinase